MTTFSTLYTPTLMKRGEVFSAWQYPRQAFANRIDPVLNIDWFEMKGPVFSAHPHAGFSAVTYLFLDSPNGLINRDSLGETHLIHPGDLHWSYTGKGMMHDEVPIPEKGIVQGLQIFINLPVQNQGDNPCGYPVEANQISIIEGEGWKSYMPVNGTHLGDVKDALPVPVCIQEISIDKIGTHVDISLPSGWGGILIVLNGSVRVDTQGVLRVSEAIGFSSELKESFLIASLKDRTRIAVVMGQQLNQPIYVQGPLMMATPEALEHARAYVSTLSIPGNDGIII